VHSGQAFCAGHHLLEHTRSVALHDLNSSGLRSPTGSPRNLEAMAPLPETLNPDVAGCGHCGRIRSRKWLVAEMTSGTFWFCAGEKAKHGCRSKAKAHGAVVWNRPAPPTSASSVVEAEPGVPMPIVQAPSRPSTHKSGPSSAAASSSLLAPLPSLIMAAWQRNDALLMSQALARAHQSGYSLCEALSLTLNISPPPSKAPLSLAASLPAEMRKAFETPGNICAALVRRGGLHVWEASHALQERLGVRSGRATSSAEVSDWFSSFIHPVCSIAGLQMYEQLGKRLVEEGKGRIGRARLPPSRLGAPDAERFEGYEGELWLQLWESPDEHALLCHWWPMGAKETSLRWANAELLRSDSLPIVIIEEQPQSPFSLYPLHARLVAPHKRLRGDGHRESAHETRGESGRDSADGSDGGEGDGGHGDGDGGGSSAGNDCSGGDDCSDGYDEDDGQDTENSGGDGDGGGVAGRVGGGLGVARSRDEGVERGARVCDGGTVVRETRREGAAEAERADAARDSRIDGGLALESGGASACESGMVSLGELLEMAAAC